MSKVPFPGSRGCSEASDDADRISRWWTRTPNANLGIATGRGSGLVVVDIDPRHGGDVFWAELCERNGGEPETVSAMTGGGGRHLYFRYPAKGAVKNSAGKVGPGIDVRGDGGYVVAPPSVHGESGRAYAWDRGPDEATVAELPTWLGGCGRVWVKGTAGNLAGIDLGGVHLPHDGSGVPIGGRNNAAASLAGQAIRDGSDQAETLAGLREWNRTNLPPLPDSELEAVVASVWRTHLRNHPLDVVPVEVPEPEPAPVVPAPVVREPDRGMDQDLLNPPGLVGELCRWINDTAYKPQPILALGNALAFCGALMGRKVASWTDLRTNIYALGVGESGSGKDHSRKQIKRLCRDAGLTDRLLGGEDVTSDAAILTALNANPACLFQFDEVGHLIGAATGKNASPHARAIPVALTKLFSSASTTFIGKEYANRKENPRQDLDQPCCCLYGTTVPSRLYQAVTPDEIRDGFLGRMIVFASTDPDPMEVDRQPTGVPKSLVTACQVWYALHTGSLSGNIAAVTHPQPIGVTATQGALDRFTAFRDVCRTRKATARQQWPGMGLDAVWARAMEHAQKVAIVIASGCWAGVANWKHGRPGPECDEAIADWSVRLIDFLTTQAVSDYAAHVGANDLERDHLAVLKAIRAKGPEGMTLRELTRTFRRLGRELLSQVVRGLGDTSDIAIEDRKSPYGRPIRVFVAQ